MDCFTPLAMTPGQSCAVSRADAHRSGLRTRNHDRAVSCGLACGTHARNMCSRIAPYCYGLAARARRTYNDVACSGGAGRSFITTSALPLEATRPGLLGTPGLVYSSSHRSMPLAPFGQLYRNHRGHRIERAVRLRPPG